MYVISRSRANLKLYQVRTTRVPSLLSVVLATGVKSRPYIALHHISRQIFQAILFCSICQQNLLTIQSVLSFLAVSYKASFSYPSTILSGIWGFFSSQSPKFLGQDDKNSFRFKTCPWLFINICF